MAAAGEFPQRQRVPCVDDDTSGGQSLRGQQANQQDEHNDLAADHRGLDSRYRLADPGDGEKDRFRDWRVDRRRERAADLREDIVIPQRLEAGIAWRVSVGVEAGGFDTAVPDIAVDV